MQGIRIMVDMSVPEPRKEYTDKACKLPVEDQVRDALENVLSGHESHRDWIMLNKLYAYIKSKKSPNKRMQNIIKMIEPVLAKFGYHKVEAMR